MLLDASSGKKSALHFGSKVDAIEIKAGSAVNLE